MIPSARLCFRCSRASGALCARRQLEAGFEARYPFSTVLKKCSGYSTSSLQSVRLKIGSRVFCNFAYGSSREAPEMATLFPLTRGGLHTAPLHSHLKYFLYQDRQGIRFGFGTERVTQYIRRKGGDVLPERFATQREAEEQLRKHHAKAELSY
jgi:hypothetical protein